MIEHKIKHKMKPPRTGRWLSGGDIITARMEAKRIDVVPSTVFTSNADIVGDCVSVVRRRWMKGKDVNMRDQAVQMFMTPVRECAKRCERL